ncbi:peptidoglycan-binding protein LysM [Rothia sp. HMSC065D02]|nr:peptidoglycan-binding protein LysM [Rothia sp. HMSC065D02]
MAAATSSSRIPAGLTVIHPARVRQDSYQTRSHYASSRRSRMSHPRLTSSQSRAVYETSFSATPQKVNVTSSSQTQQSVNGKTSSGQRRVPEKLKGVSVVNKRNPSFFTRAMHRSRALKNWVFGIPLITLAALVVLGAFILISPHTANAGNNSQGAGTRYVTVQSGDTLWDIAQEVDPKTDPRDTMVQISKLNDLQGSTVKVGQRLEVPNVR